MPSHGFTRRTERGTNNYRYVAPFRSPEDCDALYRTAVARYLAGEPVALICDDLQIQLPRLYRFLKRAKHEGIKVPYRRVRFMKPEDIDRKYGGRKKLPPGKRPLSLSASGKEDEDERCPHCGALTGAPSPVR